MARVKTETWRIYTFMDGTQIAARKLSAWEKKMEVAAHGRLISTQETKIAKN